MIQMNIQRENRGSIVLVALCFVAVLGIALASYLAVSNQAMKLSNRAQQQSVSRQLAEMGIEQALWSFNRNNWDPALWTVDTTNHRASRTVTFPNTKYGNGVTGSINIRVDNYDAYSRTSAWNAGINYQLGDLVSFTNGMWYRCIQPHVSTALLKPPNLSYWADIPIGWTWSPDASYTIASGTTRGGIVCYGSASIWYLHINNSNPSTTPPSASNSDWKSLSWNSSFSYSFGDFALLDGKGYICTNANSNVAPPNTGFWNEVSPFYPWEYGTAITYSFNDVVFDSGSGNWFRCVASSSTNAFPSDWENALSDSWKWRSTISYNLNDVVYFGASFYRCALANSNQSPPDATYWSADPLLPPSWDAGRYYKTNDVALCNGTWYLCLSSYRGKYPPTNSDASLGLWAPAPQSLPSWHSTQNYGINDMVSYGGAWYRCIAPHLNQPTTNTTYWTPIAGASYQWNATITYTTSSYVSFDGVWYHCIVGNSDQSPNNSSYWSALGAPIVYAEGAATLPDNTAKIKTQFRANVAKATPFPNAAAATTTLKIAGSGIVDSFDGSVYSKSNDIDSSYQYNNSSPVTPYLLYPNLSYSAVLSSTGTANPAVTITNAKVNGYVAAPSLGSPFSPIWSYGGSAVLTGTASGTGIDLSRVSRSPYVPLFDTLPQPSVSVAFALGNLPKGTAIPLPASADTTLNLGTPGGVTASRYFYDNGNPLTIEAGNNLYYKTININGPVILYVNGSLRVRSGGLIDIKNTGSAEIHCDYIRTYGTTPSPPTSDGIWNRTSDPKKLIVIADASSFAPSYLDNGSSSINTGFCGVLFAPNTSASLGLDIRTGVSVYGALLAKKITFSSDAALHYDTSLRYATFGGVDSPFTITEWRELTDPAEKIVFP